MSAAIRATHEAPFAAAPSSRRSSGTLLPDPEPRTRRFTVISVDDHLVEPPDMFEGRVASRFADRAPRIVRTDEGEAWTYEGRIFRQIGLNAVAGRPQEDWVLAALDFSEMRRGCFDVKARVHDMDLDGVWASVNFPSQISGFCGTVFAQSEDLDLGHAVMQAWNDWFFEEWYSPFPERVVPMGLTWLNDGELGAAEIRRNAERGFRAVSLPEQPHRIGLPSMFTRHWDPILQACVETDTVVCLHVGSTGLTPGLPPESPQLQIATTLFGSLALNTCAEWIWSGVLTRFPDLKVALSEGGIGWVPMLLDRLEYVVEHGTEWREVWPRDEVLPADVLRRNFWFCTIHDGSVVGELHRIGVDRVMIETDYPHADSTWPDSQEHFGRMLAGLPDDAVERVTHRNAAELFRHPLPPPGWLQAG